MRRLAFVVLAGMAAVAVTGAKQPAAFQVRDPGAAPQTGTGMIAGSIMTSDSPPQPVRHATVTVSGGGLRTQLHTVTDISGRFTVADLPAGTFFVSASKPSYVPAAYGARHPGQIGTPIILAAGQRVVVEVTMSRGAVIMGTVRDPYGRPKPQIRVQALEYKTQNGVRRLQQAGNGNGTDDRGMYRVFGLEPGEYVIVAVPQDSQDVRVVTPDEIRWAQQGPPPGLSAATTAPPPPPGPTVGFSPIYYPGVPAIGSATTITLAIGEERAGLDFQLQAVPTAKVEGIVLDPDGRPPQQTQLNLIADERLSSLVPQIGFPNEYANVNQENGQFALRGVTPGRYTLFARSTIRPPAPMTPPVPPPPGPNPTARGASPGVPSTPPPPPLILWAMSEIEVNGRDISNLSITLRPGLTVSGRVVFEHETLAPPADLTRVRVNLSVADLNPTPMSSGSPSSAARADGTFTLAGATPGRYRLTGSAPGAAPQAGSWMLKSVVAGGRELIDSTLDLGGTDVSDVTVTFTDRVTQLTGMLLDTNGAPTKDLSVLIFSTDPAFWTPQSRRTRIVQPAPDGKYRVASWPPGEYFLVAVTNGDQIDLTDRVAMQQIAASALRVVIGEGEKKVVDLKVAK